VGAVGAGARHRGGIGGVERVVMIRRSWRVGGEAAGAGGRNGHGGKRVKRSRVDLEYDKAGWGGGDKGKESRWVGGGRPRVERRLGAIGRVEGEVDWRDRRRFGWGGRGIEQREVRGKKSRQR